MQWIEKIAEDYAEKFTTKLDDALQKIYDDTLANHEHAHMMSSDVQGKFLEFISSLLQPKYILEIGTFTGFSAICLAKNPVHHDKTKHFENKVYFIRDKVEDGSANVQKIHTSLNHVDMLTKSLPGNNFERCLVTLNVTN